MSNIMEKLLGYRPVEHNEALSSSGSEEDVMLMPGLRVARRSSWPRRLWQLLGLIVITLLYTAFVVMITERVVGKGRPRDGRIVRSPAEDYVKYEVREIDYLDWKESSDFFGEPSPEIDSNWHELVRYHNIGLPASFMEKLGRDYQGVKFPDGRYLGSMMAFHHLHCLKHIYHTLHPEYYSIANKTGEEAAAWHKHTEHCMGAMKAYVMCKADPTIETMLWDDKKPLPLHNVTSTHQCVNWESMLDYAKDNNVDVFADGMLVHPVFEVERGQWKARLAPMRSTYIGDDGYAPPRRRNSKHGAFLRTSLFYK
ncbi:hypothetical protein BJ170DRAFT_687338 [Xylariales sp. AK1849]|nr:hypothetical protein BJ170DRAFT_687338 [Xylariales sp. AK1849]